MTIIRTTTGKYFASFVVTVEDGAEMLESVPDPEAETGIDLGLKDFAVLRGGKVIESPKFFRRMERKIARAQRCWRTSRKDRKTETRPGSGSRNYTSRCATSEMIG